MTNKALETNNYFNTVDFNDGIVIKLIQVFIIQTMIILYKNTIYLAIDLDQKLSFYDILIFESHKLE